MTEENKVQSKSIYSKIIEIQQEIKKVEPEEADGLRFATVNHWDITTSVKEAALKKGLAILPYVKTTSHEGNDTWVTVAIQITDTETGEQIVIGDYPGQGRDTQDKGPGKAISYAIKTAFLKIFMMGVRDDTENEQDQDITINIIKEALSKANITFDQLGGVESSAVICQKFVQDQKPDIERLNEEYKEAKKKSTRQKKPIAMPEALQDIYNKVYKIAIKAQGATNGGA